MPESLDKNPILHIIQTGLCYKPYKKEAKVKDQNKEINETIKRTKRYWYADGFSEIGVGLFLILIMLFNHAASLTRQPTVQIILYVVGLPALILLGGRGLSRVVVALKEKYTYPRTGYVAYKHKSGAKRWTRVILAALLGASVGAVTSLLAGRFPVIYQQIFVSVVIALAYLYIGTLLGLGRFYGITAATLTLGGALILAGVSETQFFMMFFIGQGVIWIISGLVALRQYFGSTQPPAEAGEG
jgi:MFS family permease